MKGSLKVEVKANFDDIQAIIDEIKALQTYKLFENDDMLLVSREEVGGIFARHVKTTKVETHADKIRNMNDDELADYLGNIDEFHCAADDGVWKCKTKKTCRDCIFDWLRKEADNGQN